MADYTLPQAAIAVGRNRSTLLRAVKSGKLAAVRDEITGGWRVSAAELHRLYPAVHASDANGGNAPARTDDASAELAALQAHHADAIRVRDEMIADLRCRLDAADADRREAHGQLREALAQIRLLAAPVSAAPAPARRWWRWRRT